MTQKYAKLYRWEVWKGCLVESWTEKGWLRENCMWDNDCSKNGDCRNTELYMDKSLKDIVTEKWLKLKEAEKIQSSYEEMDSEG